MKKEEDKEWYDDLKDQKKERHQTWYDLNTKILENCKYNFIWSNDTCILFREEGPKVDFYPHTGRWRYKNKTYSGGATRFLK